MKKSNLSATIRNQKGQTLIEYLIIVSLLGVGSIVIMSKVGQQLNGRFATVIKSLGGNVKGNITSVSVTANQLKRKNLANFDTGSKEASDEGSKGDSGATENSPADNF